LAVCRLKCGPRVTDRKILYLNNHRHGQSSSKKSRKKRVHLLFDDDGNAVDATSNASSSSVTQRVKSFLQAVNTDATGDQRTSSELEEISGEATGDCLEFVCGPDEQNVCSSDDITDADVNAFSAKFLLEAGNGTATEEQITSSELGLASKCDGVGEQNMYSSNSEIKTLSEPCSSASTVTMPHAFSSYQNDIEDADTFPPGNCDDMNSYNNVDDDSSNAEVVPSSKVGLSFLTMDVTDPRCSHEDDIDDTAASAAKSVNCEAENQPAMVADSCTVWSSSSSSAVICNDPEIRKYWYQRYRLFSRFDRGIRFDRG